MGTYVNNLLAVQERYDI